MKKSILFLLIATLLISIAGCSSSSGPEATIKQFETAINNKDAAKLIECLEPTMQEAIKTQMETQGMDNAAFMELMTSSMSLGESSKVTMKVLNSKIDGDTAELEVEAEYDGNKDTSTITLKKVENKWYLSGF